MMEMQRLAANDNWSPDLVEEVPPPTVIALTVLAAVFGFILLWHLL